MSDFSLVLPCPRCVGKYNFDLPFTNKMFVIQLINSNRQYTQPVYRYRLHFSYKSLKCIFWWIHPDTSKQITRCLLAGNRRLPTHRCRIRVDQ